MGPSNLPWEDKPAGSPDVMWRYSRNPIVPHDAIPNSNSLFNSAVVPFGDGFAGVFRCDSKTRQMQLHAGRSDDGHTPFGDIYYSESPDMVHWGRHRFVMGASAGWQATKIGAGPIPIETEEGWLLIYHGVLTSCNGFVYSFGGASFIHYGRLWL